MADKKGIYAGSLFVPNLQIDHKMGENHIRKSLFHFSWLVSILFLRIYPRQSVLQAFPLIVIPSMM